VKTHCKEPTDETLPRFFAGPSPGLRTPLERQAARRKLVLLMEAKIRGGEAFNRAFDRLMLGKEEANEETEVTMPTLP